MSALQLLVKKADRNLLDVLTKLPQLGVGSRVTRKAWEPYGDSFWEVTAVKPATADGKTGEVGVNTRLLCCRARSEGCVIDACVSKPGAKPMWRVSI
jgi:hypothetical protein